MVSHEIKTPVAVIKANAELALARAAPEGIARDVRDVRSLTVIREQSVRLTRLIDDLLDLQRLEGDALILDAGRVDLGELTRGVVAGVQATAAHDIAVATEEGVVGHVDGGRIEQVLVNLLQNAVRYSPAGGPITVTVRRAPAADGTAGRALLAVRDRGIGVAPADLSRIFARFYQAEGGRLHKGVKGLGIGLYLAREIVRRHGGAIWAESDEGAGSTFHVAPPLADAAD